MQIAALLRDTSVAEKKFNIGVVSIKLLAITLRIIAITITIMAKKLIDYCNNQ